MRCKLKRMLFALTPAAMVLACCGEARALIAGRDAEAKDEALEKQGKFQEAAVWRLVAARGFRELIIPFEIEAVRAYSQAGNDRLARICADRAEVLYPRKVRRNRQRYEQDIQKAGGQKLRPQVEQEAAAILAKYAPIPLAVPSRLSRVEKEEAQQNWPVAADYRELAGRIFLRVTVPFFEKASDAAPGEGRYRQLQIKSLQYLRLAHESFAAAAANYSRAAQASGRKADADPARRSAFYLRKAAEMKQQAETVSLLIAAKAQAQQAWRK